MRSVVGAVKYIQEVIEHNANELRNALAMVDMHQMVLQRVARDMGQAIRKVRKLQVDGDISLSEHDFHPLKLRDSLLDMRAYYEEWRKTANAAGPEAADTAVVIWSHGNSPEDAAERAKLEVERRAQAQAEAEAPVQTSDPDYEIEHFGGNLGQNHHQQDTAVAQENG